MGLQYAEDDEDDLDDDDDDTEIGEEPPTRPTAAQPREMSRVMSTRPNTQSAQAGSSRQMRIRPMKPAMASKHPNVVSILLTHNDGRQVMFTRK